MICLNKNYNKWSHCKFDAGLMEKAKIEKFLLEEMKIEKFILGLNHIWLKE